MQTNQQLAGPAARQRIMISMTLALALVVSAMASLNVALPFIAQDLGASQTELQWIVDAYGLVFAGLLLSAGALGDKYGRKRTLVIGLAIFGLAHTFGAVVDEPSLLIGARGIAGIGSALVMPSTLSIITTTFPPEQRARAVGTWAGVAGGGAMLGLLLSGSLVEATEWRWVFAANSIWALLALTLALRWVPHSRDAGQPALDYGGALLSTAGLSAVVFATIEGPERGWSDGLIVGGFLAGAVLLIGFVLWELRRTHPMLDPRLFKLRGFRTGTLSLALQFFAMFGVVFAALQYLQLVLDYSPLTAAFALVPMGLFVGMMSRGVAPRLMVRFGHRVVNAAGLAVLAGGFTALATLGTHSSYGHIVGSIILLGIGIGLATAPATASIVQSLPPAKQGVASAVNDTAREVGGAVGIAVLGSVLNAGYRSGVEGHLGQLPPEGAKRARDALAFVVNAAESADVPEPVRQAATELLPAARDAFVSGLSLTMTVAAIVAVAGSLLVFGRGRRSDHQPAMEMDAGTDIGAEVEVGTGAERVPLGVPLNPTATTSSWSATPADQLPHAFPPRRSRPAT